MDKLLFDLIISQSFLIIFFINLFLLFIAIISWKRVRMIVNYNYDGAIRRIHGENINDFFGVGDFGNVFHFNGLTTKHYHELSNTLKYASVYQLGDMVVIVNAYLSQVIIGKRIL